MKMKFLSSKDFEEDGNYGDCILIDNGKKLVVFDCGSIQMADKVIEYMNQNNFDKADVILSHNDADHFNGIQTLIDNEKVKSITTLLLLKYVDDIYDKINDKRKTKESLKQQIEELYDNIYKLSGNFLKDALDDNLFISNDIKVVGPDTEYFIEAVAKHLDTRESDHIDGETIMNAISVQLEINFDGKKALLTGDACYEALKDKVTEYDAIQLPHHGKDKHAEDIFDQNSGRNQVIYMVSDNTGNSNGGSDNLYELPTQGKRIKNTKDGDFEIEYNSFAVKPKENLGF